MSLLVFCDPRYLLTPTAWRDGSMVVVTDQGCAEEFQRVLAYRQLKLEAARQASIYAEFLRLARLQPSMQPVLGVLPTCKDADDQKFLELAFTARADFLVTGDKALLTLNRARFRLPFEILSVDKLEQRFAGRGPIRRQN